MTVLPYISICLFRRLKTLLARPAVLVPQRDICDGSNERVFTTRDYGIPDFELQPCGRNSVELRMIILDPFGAKIKWIHPFNLKFIPEVLGAPRYRLAIRTEMGNVSFLSRPYVLGELKTIICVVLGTSIQVP